MEQWAYVSSIFAPFSSSQWLMMTISRDEQICRQRAELMDQNLADRLITYGGMTVMKILCLLCFFENLKDELTSQRNLINIK